MKDNLSRYTLRVDLALSDKLGYIAKYEGRTKNRELEQMIKIQFCFGCFYEVPGRWFRNSKELVPACA